MPRLLDKRRTPEAFHWFVLEMNQRFPDAFRAPGGVRKPGRKRARLSGRMNRRPIMTAVEKTGVMAGCMEAPKAASDRSPRGERKAQSALRYLLVMREERRNRWREQYRAAGHSDEYIRQLIIARELDGGYTSAGVDL